MHTIAQVAFVELPKFGMDLTAYGGEMWMLNPIKSFFFNIIRDAVLGQYVFPDALSVPIDQVGGFSRASRFCL